jgi:hypothetical protein
MGCPSPANHTGFTDLWITPRVRYAGVIRL